MKEALLCLLQVIMGWVIGFVVWAGVLITIHDFGVDLHDIPAWLGLSSCGLFAFIGSIFGMKYAIEGLYDKMKQQWNDERKSNGD